MDTTPFTIKKNSQFEKEFFGSLPPIQDKILIEPRKNYGIDGLEIGVGDVIYRSGKEDLLILIIATNQEAMVTFRTESQEYSYYPLEFFRQDIDDDFYQFTVHHDPFALRKAAASELS
jgi:hypothetical protein